MTPLLLYGGGPIPLGAGLVMLAAVLASSLLLFLLLVYFRKRPAPDPRAANLRTAAGLALLVALFLALFTTGTRLNWGWGSSWVLFLEAAAYAAAAVAILFVARRKPAGAA